MRINSLDSTKTIVGQKVRIVSRFGMRWMTNRTVKNDLRNNINNIEYGYNVRAPPDYVITHVTHNFGASK